MIARIINESEFIEAFDKMGRGDNFSIPGRRALFEYLSDYAESTGETVELDVIGICCDWAEYESAHDAYLEYEGGESGHNSLLEPYWTGSGRSPETASTEWIENQTMVFPVDGGGVIIQQF